MASETEHLKGVEPEVLGQRFLRVFTLAGDCILEKRHEEIRHHRSVGDIIQLLCQKMDLKPCRLVLLDGRMRLKPQQPLIWPPSDWELQVVTVPGPSLDVGRELSLKPARILAVERRGCEINVRIEPGKLLEEVDEDVRLHHLVTLTAPPFESMVEVEVQGNDALLPLESFMAGPGLSCGFDELKIHYGQVTLRYWATGEFHSELGGGTVTQQGCPAKKGGQATRVDQN